MYLVNKMGLISWLKKLFVPKEREIEFPFEFATVNYTKEAKKYGIFEDLTTEIRHYHGQEYSSYYYNESLLNALDRQGVPISDLRKKEIELPIKRVINPQVIMYTEVE